MEMDDSWGLFLNTAVEQLRAKLRKNAVQIIEQNRTLAVEELMKIGPSLIREFAQVTIVEDYRKTLFDDQLARLRPCPASLEVKRQADCYFDHVLE